MADAQEDDLPTFTPVVTDYVRGVDDPAGTPSSGNILISALHTLYNSVTATLTNKTLTAPTIADFTNMAHDHLTTDAGGGALQFPDGFMRNGRINVTVVSNDLIVAVKTFAGADPTAADPVEVWIAGVRRTITAALSVTLADATNWFASGSAELATKERDYFTYLIWNTGPVTDIVDIGASPIPSGRVYSDFSATSTNEKYLAYGNATAPAATDDLVVVGRFAATLSAGAGYTWTVPTFTSANLIQRPIFETRWLNWTPTFAGFSANPTDYIARYMITPYTVRFVHRALTAGTSNATTFTFTVPFTPSSLTNGLWQGLGNMVDNGASLTTPGRIAILAGDPIVQCFSNAGAGAWTASGGKRIGAMQITEFEY